MRVSIHTLGTRGDVQPYVALALGLVDHGHTVQIVAPLQFAEFVGAHGLAFVGLTGDFLALLNTPEGKVALAGGQGFSAGCRLLRRVRPLMRQLLDNEWDAVNAFRPDLILYHPKSIASPHMAEAIGRPCILATPVPGFTPTSAFPTPLLPFTSLGPLNRMSHLLAIRGADLLFSKQISEWRRATLGLPGASRAIPGPAATIYAYSRHVLPPPPDWPDNVLVSGYWFLDSGGWKPPPALLDFLEAGEQPVYVGFGSMPGLEPERLTSTVLQALAKVGKRAIMAIGGGAVSVDEAAGAVFVISEAPHEALLPLVSGTVHHGGAGTTAASLRAGKPMVICPFFGDQPFWGRRIAELGLGPKPVEQRTLTADQLARSLNVISDPLVRERASAFGVKIREENGVVNAVEFIERIVSRGPT